MHQSEQERFLHEIKTTGFSILNNCIPKEWIPKLKMALQKAITAENEYHGSQNHPDKGMVLLCSLYDDIFTDIFTLDTLTKPFEIILGEGCIVYAYTSSSMPPNETNFSRRIHVDCPRIIDNYITNVGATILLDDFTEENGATYFLPNSFNKKEQPTDEEFYKNSIRLIAPAGSICFFNARTWHAGGTNSTEKWRHALTINMVRPWMKQRLDIPRAMNEVNKVPKSDKGLQKLGFWSQVPANYNEYYVPKEDRKFKQPQE